MPADMHQQKMKLRCEGQLLCEELKHMFNKFLKHHIKMSLGNVNAKVCREGIFKPIRGNDSLHKISNDNRIKLSKSEITAKSTSS
jgi:hypothetical protein